MELKRGREADETESYQRWMQEDGAHVYLHM